MLIPIYAIFWILIYFIEGLHNVAIMNQLGQTTGWKDEKKADYYSGVWHTLDAIVFALIHIAGAIIYSAFVGIFTVTHVIILIAISVGIRCTIHDLVINVGLGAGWNYVPHCGGLYDFWDYFIAKMDEIGINQYFIRIPLLVIPFIIYYLVY